jgi:hypothetical protein
MMANPRVAGGDQMSMVGAFLVVEARLMATFNPEIPRDRRSNLLNELTKGMDNDPNEIKVGRWIYGAGSSIFVTFSVQRDDDRLSGAPVPEKPSSPEPSKSSTVSVKLERDKCTVVLEAVKACEVLRDYVPKVPSRSTSTLTLPPRPPGYELVAAFFPNPASRSRVSPRLK